MTFGSVFQPVFRQVFSRALGGIIYLLRDEFTTPEAAPLTSPRTCEPGPGIVTKNDSTNSLSISGGSLISSGGAFTWGDPSFVSDVFSRSAGLVCGYEIIWTAAPSNLYLGWRQNNIPSSTGQEAAIRSLGQWNGSIPIVNFSQLTNYKIYSVLRSVGSFLVVDSKLTWVDAASSDATVYTQITNYNDKFGAGRWFVRELPSPWNTDYGIATSYTASAGAGATATMEADGIAEARWQASTGVTYELDVRRTDDDNRWIVRCSQAGSTIKLIQRQAGVETERSSAAQTWTNGVSYRIVVICDTQNIKTYVANIVKNTYASAAFNQTATGVKTSHAVTNLVTWPRVLSGAALAALQAV